MRDIHYLIERGDLTTDEKIREIRNQVLIVLDLKPVYDLFELADDEKKKRFTGMKLKEEIETALIETFE